MEIVFLILSLGAAAWAVRERAASRRLLRRLGEMLERAEAEGQAIWLTEDLPRSFILVDSRWGEPVVYISPLSSTTLAHRAERGGLE